MPQVKAPEVTTSLFGGILDIDGGGHYPGLELINFVACCADGVLPGPDVARVRLQRRSHDFARRLVAKVLPEDKRSAVLLDQHSQQAVAHLLRCLELDVPNAVKAKSWERTHFFPYTRSLIHWDARARNRTTPSGDQLAGKILLERRYLRGGGALAFSVLRADPDVERLAAIRDGFLLLYPAESDTPLELLARTLLSHGESDPEPVFDTIEAQSQLRNDRLEDLYRSGVRNILTHVTSSAVQRVRAIMNWTGIWLVLLQASRAAQYLDREWSGLILDCAGTHPQLRRASQKCLKELLVNIEDAANRHAAASGGSISKQQMNKIKGFFSGTAATCGLLNSAKGRRHFTLKLDAIEALVLASSDGRDRPFEDFTSDWLGNHCGLVISHQAAARNGLLMAFDATIFEENERQFADQMRATGMLRVYSDATRMVSPEVMQ